MTNYLSLFFIFFFTSNGLLGQFGLEGIYVEPFYVSKKGIHQDTLHDGDLPKGSITYRVYLDLKPGYTFQAAYGAPGHPLYFGTDKFFYNHQEYGNSCPAFIPEQTLSKSLVVLDSWFTAGIAGENHLAIPLYADDTTHDTHIRFPKTIKHSDKTHTFPIADGMRRVEDDFQNITFYNMDEAKTSLHSARNVSRVEVVNGAWACMGKGVQGYDPNGENLVLIAQLTTNGKLSFGLNIMIGTPDGKSERYVYQNPGQDEIEVPFLKRKASKKFNQHVTIK